MEPDTDADVLLAANSGIQAYRGWMRKLANELEAAGIYQERQQKRIWELEQAVLKLQETIAFQDVELGKRE